jgi:hypothetical protein
MTYQECVSFNTNMPNKNYINIPDIINQNILATINKSSDLLNHNIQVFYCSSIRMGYERQCLLLCADS